MQRHRLLLELKKDDYISFKVQGSDKSIGQVRLDEKSPLAYANLVFEFVPNIEIIRGRAKNKAQNCKQKGV